MSSGSRTDTEAVVLRELRNLLQEEGSSHTDVHEDDVLVDIGLDSLAFAVLITRLEDALEYDPFVAIEQGAPPRTVRELVELYASFGRQP